MVCLFLERPFGALRHQEKLHSLRECQHGKILTTATKTTTIKSSSQVFEVGYRFLID